MSAPSIRFEVPGPVLPWQRTNTFKGRKITSKEQRAYQRLVRDRAWAELLPDGGPREWPTCGRYAVSIEARVPNYAVRDLDNIGKQVCDSLQGVLFVNDSRVDMLTVCRVVEPANLGLTVTVTALVERWGRV